MKIKNISFMNLSVSTNTIDLTIELDKDREEEEIENLLMRINWAINDANKESSDNK